MNKFTKHLSANFNGRDFVIGDLHGCVSQLDLLLEHVKFDDATDRLFSVGDLVDRGEDSLAALDLVTEHCFHCVRGNHEDMMIRALAGEQGWDYVWRRNGGEWFHNLTVQERMYVRLLCNNYIEQLPWLISVDLIDGRRFHVLHAEVGSDVEVTDVELMDEKIFQDIGVKMESMDGSLAIWGRTVFMPLVNQPPTSETVDRARRAALVHKHNKWMLTDLLSDIYVGHTPVLQPTKAWKLVNIDTHAFNVKRAGTGLTLTEPLTGKFWTCMEVDGVRKVVDRELFVID